MYALMNHGSFDDYENFKNLPTTLSLALEYVEAEEEFNFYIRSVQNCPIHPTLIKRQSRAVMHLVKGISRKTSVMGWARTITWQEIEAKNPNTYKTLNVDRCLTTVFNEFFSCKVSKKDFRNTLLRIQLCDVDQYDRNVVVAEMDQWINTHQISQFTEFEFTFPPYAPDLGEVEINMMYLPTSQRLIINYCTVTNVKLDEKCENFYIRASLFLNHDPQEIHRTEKKCKSTNASLEDGVYFTKKLIFDLKRVNVTEAELLVHVVQMVEDKKLVLGQIVLSANSSDHWQQVLKSQRVSIPQIHRISPGAG